ncbi:hypothetical protein KKH36_02525 [Patescibacteria group bacterium]|nr:hypothetical protein [Patescibacteria group bacterium]
MKTNTKIYYAFLFLFINLLILNPTTTEAHQPNYIADQTNIEVIEPEISKAYYGELSGEEVIYTINSENDFELYLGILSPDLPETYKDYSVKVIDKEDNQVIFLDGESFRWERFYEEFAGDWYWKGPEFKAQVPFGEYLIKVSNPENKGKYVLAVGEIESFPLSTTFETFKQLIKVKENIFDKPWHSAFTNKMTLFTFLPILLFVIILVVVILFFKIRKQKSNS